MISFFKSRVAHFSTTKGMVGREDLRGEKSGFLGSIQGSQYLLPSVC